MLLDALLLGLAVLVSYAARFEGLDWQENHRRTALAYAVFAIPLKLLIFYAFGLYRRLWRHASIAELENILSAGAVAGIACALLGIFALPHLSPTSIRVPLSVVFLDAFFTVAIAAASRLVVRLVGWRAQLRHRRDDKRVLIVGAGSAGEMIAKELLANRHLGLSPVGFVDDDPAKQNHRLHGLPIFGTLEEIPRVCKSAGIREVVIAMPAAPGSVVREVVRLASDAGARTRTVPGLSDILSGRVKVTALRQVEIQDLLRREPVRTDLRAVRALATERTVLVTGAGGSIGSELCRQLAQLEPQRLVLLGHAENDIFYIQGELAEHFPALDMACVIADVRDRRRVRHVIDRYRPHAIFHAAAHKHVPLMEENVVEAITNNVLGTHNLVAAAVEFGAEHFVLISTDKAVRPTSIMGATKRVAEKVVQHAAAQCGRNFVSVRFGNVLGSNGSVIPTFLRQIQTGGPVTVTHPDMRRFFMMIPEAVQLVLQAGALGRGGEVFCLDMGEPVKVLDLARDLIRLSGLQVGTDIEIRITGIRPGEKLYEELFFSGENVVPTEHPKVLRARNMPLRDGVEHRIAQLIEAALGHADDEHLRKLLTELVPDFHVEHRVGAGVAALPASLPARNASFQIGD